MPTFFIQSSNLHFLSDLSEFPYKWTTCQWNWATHDLPSVLVSHVYAFIQATPSYRQTLPIYRNPPLSGILPPPPHQFLPPALIGCHSPSWSLHRFSFGLLLQNLAYSILGLLFPPSSYQGLCSLAEREYMILFSVYPNIYSFKAYNRSLINVYWLNLLKLW